MLIGKVQWRKIFRDLSSHKIRTVLAIIPIAVGVFAVSTVARTWAILSRELDESYLAVNPASARLRLSAFQEDFVRTVRKLDSVQAVEGYTQLPVSMQLGPHVWLDLRINAFSSFDRMQIDRLVPQKGTLSPPKGTILIERSTLDFINADLGDSIVVKTKANQTAELQIAGIVKDLTQHPTNFAGIAYGYITLDTMEMLGYSRHPANLRLIVAGDTSNEDYIQQVVEQVSDKAEKAGLFVYDKDILRPESPLDDVFQSMLLILGTLGILALLLSIFLITNSVSVLLTRQIRQIGIMKTIGAQKWHILRLYITTVCIFGLLAWAISIPPATLSARGLALFLARAVNIDITSFAVPPAVWAVEIGASLIAPLCATLLPIVSGARLTINEAISDFRGIPTRFGTSAADRLVSRVRGVDAAFLYSLRNIFRRKARLALILIALSTVSTIFVTIANLRVSLLRSADNTAAYWQEDISLILQRPYRTLQVKRLLSQIPGIVHIEPQKRTFVFRLHPDGSESQRNFIVDGFLATSRFIRPTLLEGRWLRPEDRNVIVINTELLNQEPDLKIGDEIAFKIKGRETTWRIVGVVTSALVSHKLFAPIAYVNQPYLAKVMHETDVTDRVLIETKRHAPAFQDKIGQAISEHLDSNGIGLWIYRTYNFKRSRLETLTNAVVYLFIAMAVLFAAIGALGLMSMMSMNVLERTHEIGVIRAIGAPSWIVKQLVMVEGIIIGVLSWILGSILAVPLSKVLSDAVGKTFFHTPLDYTYSITGVFLWLVIVIILSALASFVPGRHASQLSIRDVLMYE